MNNRLKVLIICILVCLAAGCYDDLFVVDTLGVPLPTDVHIRMGDSVYLPREGYVITFKEVVADSRCPIGVTCVWEGDGAVRLSFREDAGDTVVDTLHTTLEPKAVQVGTATVRLKKLAPYPVGTQPIEPEQYIVTLEINRASQGREGSR